VAHRRRTGNHAGDRNKVKGEGGKTLEKEEGMKKDTADTLIDAVLIITVFMFLTGIMIAIWTGIIGLKIAGTAAVIFFADWAVSIWVDTVDAGKKEKERA
jgi:hypothetical protein